MNSEGLTGKIVGAVIVALLVGGSYPWWWKLLVPPPKPPYMDALLWETNLQGGDMANIDRPEVNTAGECSELCLKHEQCKAMTFVQHPSATGGICWLKSSVPERSSNPQMASAIKRFP